MDNFRTRAIVNSWLVVMLGNEENAFLWWNSPNKAFKDHTPEEIFATDPQAVAWYVRSYLQI